MQFSNFILMAVLVQMSNGFPVMNLFDKRAIVTELVTSVVHTTVTVGGDDATTSSTPVTTSSSTTATPVKAVVTASASTSDDSGAFTTTLSGEGWGPITVTIDAEDLGKTTWIEFTPTAEAAASTTSAPVTTTSSTSTAPTTTAAATTSTAEAAADQHNKITTSSTSSTEAESTSATSTTSSSTSSSSGDFKSNMLNLHNAKRALHNVDDLTWDDDAEAYAQAYADKYDCSGTLTHSGGSYGENLAIGYSDDGTIEAWYGEGDNYTYGSSCSVYDHFTAMIWKSTTSLGCAKKYCGNVWGNYIICSYNPAGNVVTECDTNVLPLSS